MDNRRHSPEDLVVLARRGGLSGQQLDELEQGLQLSSTLRVADDVGRAFDAIADVREGDEQRIAGWVDRVVDRAQPAPARAPRVWRVGLIAAIVLGSASTMAYWGVRSSRQREAQMVQARRPDPSTSTKNVLPRLRTGSDSAAPAVSATTEPTASAAPALEPASRDVRPTPKTDAPSGPDRDRGSDASGATAAFPAEVLGPAAVFSAANAARRAGRQNRAIALYRDLQRDYPGSAEAGLSHVSLGRLLLTRGQLDGALAQFSTYLRGGGPLEEEALLGKAQTLAALGRPGEERAAWQTLLRRYPHSVYAGEAQERLGRDPR